MSGLTQIAVFVLTNTRWAQIRDEKQREIQIADGRNPNCKWEKYWGEMQEIRRGRVRMQIARGFPPSTTGHLASSLPLLMKIEDVQSL